ncbi:hypothetical protein R1flu_006617 [Riccia fluitans]|uniref:MSP domain-containing protein n=1 Tax=Riccia fluitans TaxID=41844 RepID=A0ABD1YX93_9MARC
MGLLLPHKRVEITVTMQAQKESPPDMHCKDKFVVQSVIAPRGITAKDISSELFKEKEGKKIAEAKLRDLLVTPPQHKASISEWSPKSVYGSDNRAPSRLPTDNPVGEGIVGNGGEVHGSIVQIGELSFRIPCENHESKEILRASRRGFCVALQQSRLTMQAQKEAPRNMQCKDKFLVQSVIASYGITSKDAASELFKEKAGTCRFFPPLFKKKTGYKLSETKLRVVFTTPSSPAGSVPERSPYLVSTDDWLLS